MAGKELCEPTLLAYELANFARGKAQRDPEQRERILERLEDGVSMEMELMPVAHLAVCGLALETGLTAYDASHLYLARTLSIPLLTFDAQLASSFRATST